MPPKIDGDRTIDRRRGESRVVCVCERACVRLWGDGAGDIRGYINIIL